MNPNQIDANQKFWLMLLALASSLFFSSLSHAADTTTQDSPAKKTTASPSKSKPVKPTTTDEKAEKSKGLPYYAKVGDMFVTWIDYNNEYATESRKKFYHGRPSESTQALFQRQIGDTLITNAMLVQEARRRGIKPDEEFVKQQLEQYDQRFAKNPNWKDAKKRVLPILTKRVENENLRTKLEEQVRAAPEPTTKQLQDYYDHHLDKFTAPVGNRVSVILLKVDPGASATELQGAMDQAQDLVKRLRAGEDFAKMAREYSGDKTAADGGDMGYLHEGMLPGLPEETVSKLNPGETSDPVNLMEGVGIFRLTERTPSKVNSFDSVKDRVKDLWAKEQTDKAWNTLIAKLKKETPLEVDNSHFLPLPETKGTTDNATDEAKPDASKGKATP